MAERDRNLPPNVKDFTAFKERKDAARVFDSPLAKAGIRFGAFFGGVSGGVIGGIVGAAIDKFTRSQQQRVPEGGTIIEFPRR